MRIMKNRQQKKIFIFLFIAFIVAFFIFDFLRYFDLKALGHYREILLQFTGEKTLFSIFYLFLIYLLMATFSLPGTIFLTLFAGFLFGLVKGVILVSLALTLGSTITFLLSRSLLRKFFIKKYASQLKFIVSDLNEYGIYYLFAMRMILFIPLFIPNTIMGLTSMKTKHFFIVTYIGLLPELIIFVNAGQHFSKIEQIKDIFSIGIITSFFLIGFLPLVVKKVLYFLNKTKKLNMEVSDDTFKTEIINKKYAKF